MTWLEGAGLVALGVFVGAYGTMVGVGGGFLIVPALLFMHVPPRMAAGTSLAVVFANAASGTVSYLRQRRVNIRSGLIFSIAGLPGAFLGAYVDQHLPHRLFTILFGILLVAVAVRLFVAPKPRQQRQSNDDRSDAAGELHYNVWLAIGIAFVVGFVASMFGIGGGVVQVPAMVYLFGFPAHVATATSHFTIALTSLFGTASHVRYHDVLALPAVLLACGAIVGAQFGAALSRRVEAGPLLRWLSLAVIIAAVYLLVGLR